jgi:hypothetical protein
MRQWAQSTQSDRPGKPWLLLRRFGTLTLLRVAPQATLFFSTFPNEPKERFNRAN